MTTLSMGESFVIKENENKKEIKICIIFNTIINTVVVVVLNIFSNKKIKKKRGIDLSEKKNSHP